MGHRVNTTKGDVRSPGPCCLCFLPTVRKAGRPFVPHAVALKSCAITSPEHQNRDPQPGTSQMVSESHLVFFLRSSRYFVTLLQTLTNVFFQKLTKCKRQRVSGRSSFNMQSPKQIEKPETKVRNRLYDRPKANTGELFMNSLKQIHLRVHSVVLGSSSDNQ